MQRYVLILASFALTKLNRLTCLFFPILGDSGGPLLIPDRPDGNLTAGLPRTDLIVGVTSFSRGECDASEPGVYMRVSFMWEWISGILNDLFEAPSPAELLNVIPDRLTRLLTQ